MGSGLGRRRALCRHLVGHGHRRCHRWTARLVHEYNVAVRPWRLWILRLEHVACDKQPAWGYRGVHRVPRGAAFLPQPTTNAAAVASIAVATASIATTAISVAAASIAVAAATIAVTTATR